MKAPPSTQRLVRAAIAYARASKLSGENVKLNHATINRINDLLDEARRYFDRIGNP